MTIEDSRYEDYPTYIQERGLDYAKVRRELYHKHHKKNIKKKGSAGYLSSTLLWWQNNMKINDDIVFRIID